MGKKNELTEQEDVRLIIDDGTQEDLGLQAIDAESNGQEDAELEEADQAPSSPQEPASHNDNKKERLTKALKQMRDNTSEGDEAPSASLRLSDVLGGDFLWTLVRRQLWLIVLVVSIIIAYVAVRYQCQQDAIDIAQLEKDLVDAKFESLSSSSNLTRMSRQSNIVKMLTRADSTTTLHNANQPPYIIEVPTEK